MKQVFIIQHSSGLSKRVLKRIGTESNCNTLGYIVECHNYSVKLKRFKKPVIKKFKFFSDALSFVNFETRNEVL